MPETEYALTGVVILFNSTKTCLKILIQEAEVDRPGYMVLFGFDVS